MRNLQDWYETPVGRLVAELERELLDRYLDRWAGAYLLQVGGFGRGQRVLRANTSRQWLVDRPGRGAVDCALEPEHLPFQSDTLDMVVLVHSLEFSANPHRVLREAERVLAPEGRLLVLSFNLFSLWGLAHALPGLKARGAPWAGEYFGSRRIRDWLTLLDLEVVSVEHSLYRPPMRQLTLLRKLAGLERWGPRFLPWLGGVHLTLAQKHVAGLTPLVPAWKTRGRWVPAGLPQPTPREAADAINR